MPQTFDDQFGAKISAPHSEEHRSESFRPDTTYDPANGRLKKKERVAASSSDQPTSTRLAPSILYEYDEMGRIKRECLDVDEDGVIGVGGDDRITEYEYGVSLGTQNIANAVGGSSTALIWAKIDAYTYPDNGSATRLRLSTSLEQLNGYATYQGGAYTIYPSASIVRNALSQNDGSDDATTATISVTKIQPGIATVTTETKFPGVANKAISTSVNGFVTSDLSAEGVLTTNTYDAYGRLSRTHGRDNVLTDYVYWPGTSAKKSIRSYTFNPTNLGGNEWKQFSYDGVGRLNRSDRNEVGVGWVSSYYEYDQRNNLVHIWGNGETPVEYVYDNLNRRTEQHLFRNTGTASVDWTALTWPGGSNYDKTKWEYDATTGLVTSKTSPNATHPVTFTYDGNNQIKTRTSAGGIVTTYTYYDGSTPSAGARGQLKKVEYSVDPNRTTPANYVATQPTTYTYCRHGAVATVTEENLKDASGAAGVRTFTYRPQDLQLAKEKLPNFFGGGVKKLTYTYEDGSTAAGDTSVKGRYSGFIFSTGEQ
jgi:YD repeat-containing protein